MLEEWVSLLDKRILVFICLFIQNDLRIELQVEYTRRQLHLKSVYFWCDLQEQKLRVSQNWKTCELFNTLSIKVVLLWIRLFLIFRLEGMTLEDSLVLFILVNEMPYLWQRNDVLDHFGYSKWLCFILLIILTIFKQVLNWS